MTKGITAFLIVCVTALLHVSHQCISDLGQHNYGDIIPVNKIIYEGGDVNFTCILNDETLKNFTSTDIVWHFNNDRDPIDSYTIVNQSHNTLSLSNVTLKSTGNYFCMIRNRDGNLFVCSSVLTVGRKVKLENVTVTSYNLEDLRITWTVKDSHINTTYSLVYRNTKKSSKDCRVTCLPSEDKEYLHCSCYINGSVFLYLNPHQFSINSLNVLSSDIIYEDTVEPEYYIKTKPPTNLVAISKNSSSLFVSWDLEFHNPPQNISLLYYEVFCILIVNTEHEQQHYKAVNTTDKHVTFVGLIPYRNYSIKVRAKVNYITSYYSDFAIVNATTLPDIPQDAPFILPGMFFFQNSIESPRKVHIYWKDINKLSYGSPNVYYSLLLESDNSKAISISTNETIIKVEIGDDEYNATIRAVNDHGPSHKFSTIFIPAKSNILKNLELEFFLRMKNPDRLNISCVPLPKYSDVTTITVYWCKGSGVSSTCLRNLNWTISDIDSSSWEIPIDVNSHYQVATSVQSLTSSSGLKFWSDCEAIDTDNMNDLDVTLKPLSSSTILIRWQANCKQNSIIKYHIIRYCPLSNCKNDTVLEKIVAKNITEYTLYHLTPFTEYNITFFSTSVTGKKIVRKNAAVVTEQGRPGGPPLNISTEVGTHNITIAWSQPDKPNAILKYRIEISEIGKELMHKESNGTSCILPNLTENTKYHIKIKACPRLCSDSATIKMQDCTIMCSDPATIIIKTEATVPPDVLNVTIKVEETDKVSLRWILDTFDGPIDYYYVYMQWSEDAIRKTHVVKHTLSKPLQLEQKVNCSGVENEYAFKIAAVRINLAETELIGKPSNQTSVRLCKSGYPDKTILIVGCIVAGTFSLVALVFSLFGCKVFRKLREHLRIPEISLPQGITEKVDDLFEQPPRKKNGFEKKNNIYEDLQHKPHFMDSERFLGGKLKSDSESLLLDQMPTTDEFGRQISSLSTTSSGIGSGDQNSISSSTSHCTNVSSDSGTVANERAKDAFESSQTKTSTPDKFVMQSYIPKNDILFTSRFSKDFGLVQKSPIYKPESLPSVFFNANEGIYSSIKLNPGYSTTTNFQVAEELNSSHKSHSYPKLGPYYEKPNVTQCYVPLDTLKSSFAKYLPASLQNSYSKFAQIPIYDIDNVKHDIPNVENENEKPLDPYCKISSNESDITEIETTNIPLWQSKPLDTYVQISGPEEPENDLLTVNSYIIDSDLPSAKTIAEDTTFSEIEGYSLPLNKSGPEVSPYSKFIIQGSDDLSKSPFEDISPSISSDIHSFEKDISKCPYVPSVIFMNRKNSIPENYSKVCILKDKLDNAVNNLGYMQNSSTA